LIRRGLNGLPHDSEAHEVETPSDQVVILGVS
jgi:hypothetical protein